MIVKLLEIRDKATFIPAFALSTKPRNAPQRYLLRRVGFAEGNDNAVILGYLAGERHSTADPYHWGDRTMQAAHLYIEAHFDELSDGDMIDVEFILGEKPRKKISEAYE